LIWSMRRSCNI